jgi:hypothetical protein
VRPDERASEARIVTANASRYLTQLCRHAVAIGHHGARLMDGHPQLNNGVHVDVSSRGAQATITLTRMGQCNVWVDAAGLTARIDAAGEDELEQIQAIIGADLNRITRGEDIRVTWQRVDAVSRPNRLHPPGIRSHSLMDRRRRACIVAVAGVVALVLVLHAGLGVALVKTPIAGAAIAVIVLVVLLKLVIVTAGLARRRARAHRLD